MKDIRLDVIGNRQDRCSFGRSNPLLNSVLNFGRDRVCDSAVSKRNKGEVQENVKMRIRKSSPRRSKMAKNYSR